jgi:hypothetical protein
MELHLGHFIISPYVMLPWRNHAQTNRYYEENFSGSAATTTVAPVWQIRYSSTVNAGVAELADAQVLGACGEIRVGSSPSARIFLCFSRDSGSIS